MKYKYNINGKEVITKQKIFEGEKHLYLEGDQGLKPYLRRLEHGMPKNPIRQIAWLLLQGDGCGFCKVCRDKPCNIKEGESCTDNIANYIRECVHAEDAEKEQQSEVSDEVAALYKNIGNEVAIWRYNTASPLAFGKSEKKPVVTNISLEFYDVVTLNKGFKAVVVTQGFAKGVYELASGGLIGDTVNNVNQDIDACEDLSMMIEQVKQSAKMRSKASMISNEDFGLSK